ncbi:MAG: dephospho-CoA kinase [bacterium]|jgi:dephospho-CoA kinase|nr:dephospho-CoA kinase [bacterium]
MAGAEHRSGPPGRRRRIALTGGIGAGKSLLASWLRQAGCLVLDADELGRRAVEEEPALREGLAAAFGRDLIDQAGRLDRRELGRRAFATPDALERLNALVFPYLERRLREGLQHAADLVFVDAALIYEWGIDPLFDEIWVVRASDEARLARAAARLGEGAAALRRRLERQLPQEEKVRRADRVLDNDTAPEDLWVRADRLLEQLGLPRLPPASRPGGNKDQGKGPACPTSHAS